MGDSSEGRWRRTAIGALCLLAGAPLAYALARTDASGRVELLARLAVVLTVATAPPLIGRWRARRDAARGIDPASHRLTGTGLRDAMVVAVGALMLGLGVIALLVEPAQGDGLNPAVPFAIGALFVIVGIAAGRGQRR